MAKPMWFRLFGRNSDFTLEQFIDANRDSAGGDRVVLSRFFELFASTPARPDPVANVTATSPATVASQADLQSRPNALFVPTPIVTTPTIVPQVDVVALLDTGSVPDGTTAVTAPAPDDLVGGDGDRTALVTFGTQAVVQFSGNTASPFGGSPTTANYVVSYSQDFQSGLVYDANTKTLLTGGPGDWPQLGEGPDDTLELNGDFSAGFTLPSTPLGLDRVVARAGADYNLVVSDDHVGAGQTLTIDAMPLGTNNHIIFDGSAERDGRFVFFGSQSNDIFLGGGGDDRIAGLGGADMLSGGGGSDTFVYTQADQSSGTDYDTLADFTAGVDHIDLPGGVASFGDSIEGGTLSLATFNDDLSALLAGLEPAQAVWFAPDAGDLAGQIFLIIDANGVAGYQEGEDFVFAVAGAPLVDLTSHTDIFV